MNEDHLLAVIVEEAAELDAVAIAAAEIAAIVMGAVEEGDLLIGPENAWEYVDVDLDGYRRMMDASFRLHFRMNKATFEKLRCDLFQHLKDQNRFQRERTATDVILMAVIWILATPDSFRSVALRFHMTPGVVHFHYAYVIEALREMAPRFISWPTLADRRRTKAFFQEKVGFPGVAGAIDGTHIKVTAPTVQPVRYFNRKSHYSFNCQIVGDHQLLVRDLYVGEAGSLHDQRVFRRSPLYRQLLMDDDDEVLELDEHILGDGGYVCTDKLISPFRDNGHLSHQQRQFNTKLSQCRVYVEMLFGRVKMMWRRLLYLHSLCPQYAVDHITSCFVLNNYLIMNGEPVEGHEAMVLEANALDDDDDDDDARPVCDVEDEDEDEDESEGEGEGEHEPERNQRNRDPALVEAKNRGIEKRSMLMDQVIHRRHAAED